MPPRRNRLRCLCVRIKIPTRLAARGIAFRCGHLPALLVHLDSATTGPHQLLQLQWLATFVTHMVTQTLALTPTLAVEEYGPSTQQPAARAVLRKAQAKHPVSGPPARPASRRGSKPGRTSGSAMWPLAAALT